MFPIWCPIHLGKHMKNKQLSDGVIFCEDESLQLGGTWLSLSTKNSTICIQQQTPDNNAKPKRFCTTESWAKGLMLLNWESIIKLWESRIDSIKTSSPGLVLIDNHYFELQKALDALCNHRITNPNDYELIYRTQTEIESYSTNQLKLLNSNIQLLHQSIQPKS